MEEGMKNKIPYVLATINALFLILLLGAILCACLIGMSWMGG
jgi:hypothetical protein